MTMRWPIHVFCFLLAMTMVNVQNAATYFLKKPKLESLQAQHLIAKALINNVHLHTGMTPQKHPKRCSIEHVFTMVPPSKKSKGDSPIARQNMASGNASIVLTL